MAVRPTITIVARFVVEPGEVGKGPGDPHPFVIPSALPMAAIASARAQRRTSIRESGAS